MTHPIKTEPENVVPLEQAQLWVNNWKNAPSINPLSLRGFLIPEVDLTQVIAEPGVVDVRGYLGIKEDGEFKFLICGVDEFGNDLVNYDAGHYVYDFTQPCPPTCGEAGPLNT